MNPFQILSRLWQDFNMLTPVRKMTVVASGLISLAAIAAMVHFSGQIDYQTLYSNLSSEDAASIVGKLQEKKIPYKINPSGDAITVASDKIPELRMELAASGLPRGGNIGFEIFDQKSIGATEFEQKLNYRRAIQGELARTINSLEEIQQSRVHIAFAKDTLFIDQQQKSTAAVTVKLKTGKSLRQNQIDGIGHLVASSVEGLRFEDVMVVDSKGNILSRGHDETKLSQLSNSQMEYQRNVERNLTSQIQTMLENVVGKGKAVVRVTADLDFRITEKTEETYDSENPVVRSTQKQSDKAVSTSGAAKVGATSGAPGQEKDKLDEVTNYEINKVVNKTVMPVGEIKKLSIAVVVDGIYTKNDKGLETYQERSKKEIDSLDDLVRKSAGFNAARGDQVILTSMSFTKQDLDAALSNIPWHERLTPFVPVAKYLALLTAIGLLFLFVIRPLMTGLMASISRQGPRDTVQLSGVRQASLGGESMALLSGQAEGGGLTETELVKQLASTDAKRFAELLRNWVK
ncbi:MAG: flagellar basal-body MS-ring/collar protein FliF [Syntrophus sp. (in: bacteria)]